MGIVTQLPEEQEQAVTVAPAQDDFYGVLRPLPQWLIGIASAPGSFLAYEYQRYLNREPGCEFDTHWYFHRWEDGRFIETDLHATYAEDSKEWHAQHTAWFQLKHGALKLGHDRYAAIFDMQKRKRARAQEKAREREQAEKEAQERASRVTTRASQEQSGAGAMEVRNGVLTDEYLYHMRSGKLAKIRLAGAPAHIGDILQYALTYDLQTIWVMPDTHVSAKATSDFLEAARGLWELHFVTYQEKARGERGSIKFVKAWKKKEAREPGESGRAVFVGYAEHAQDWLLGNVSDPVTLLAAISYFEDATGTPALFSPATSGKAVMQAVNTKRERAQWIEHAGINQYTPLRDTKAFVSDWKRPFSDEERARSWLLAYDKNSMYPASCTSVLLGAGEPHYVEYPQFDASREKPLPGLWYCRLSGSSAFDGVTLPHPTNGELEGWFYSYTVKLLYQLGYTVEIEKAYVWDEGHTILRPFAESMWKARAALKSNQERYKHAQARALAEDMVKLAANMVLGWLDMLKNREQEADETPWFHRPDWYQLLKDNARYWMFQRIRSYLEKGYAPVGLHEDCILYVSDDSNHEEALPGMMKRAGLLGGFKRKYKRDIPAYVALPLFDSERLMSQINLELLNRERKSEQE